ncbi:MAG TPA: hypothetical protein VEA69_24230 [Tepidisphaeraceae bacterium]|nr:hypothetical protein [Tepidisphaeraceae bacterium]
MKNGNGVGGGREARSGCVAEALERRQLLAASMAAFTIGGAGGDNARDVYADRRNGTYVAGDFTGRVDFQKGVGAHVVNAGSKADPSQRLSYVAKYGRNGSVEWVRAFDDANVHVSGVEVDSAGHVYVSGGLTVAGPADLDPSRRRVLVDGTTAPNFVAKFTANGKLIWGRSVGRGQGMRMAVDPNGGGVFLAGLDYSYEGPDTNLVRLDSAGEFVWGGRVGTFVQDLVAGRRGGVFLTGTVQGSGDVDPGPGERLLATGGRPAGSYVQAIDADGALAWATVDGDSRNTRGRAVAVDAFDNVVVAGTRQYRRPRGNDDAPFSLVLQKLDRTGTPVWRRETVGGSVLGVTGVDADETGDVVVGGTYRGQNLVDGTRPDFDAGPGEALPPAAGGGVDAVFLARYGADGTFEDLDTARLEVDLTGVVLSAFASGRAGRVVAVGAVGGSVDLDDGPGVTTLTAASPVLGFQLRDGDGFVWELAYV